MHYIETTRKIWTEKRGRMGVEREDCGRYCADNVIRKGYERNGEEWRGNKGEKAGLRSDALLRKNGKVENGGEWGAKLGWIGLIRRYYEGN